MSSMAFRIRNRFHFCAVPSHTIQLAASTLAPALQFDTHDDFAIGGNLVASLQKVINVSIVTVRVREGDHFISRRVTNRRWWIL